MNLRHRLTILSVGLALTAYAGSGGLEQLSGEAKLEAFMERVSAAQAGLKTLSATFEQRKVSRVLMAPSVSRGTFYYRAPDTVCWRYDAPRRMIVLLSRGVATTYRPADKRAERIEVGHMQRKVLAFLSASEPLARLTRYFRVTLRDAGPGHNFIVELAPTSYQVKKRIASVTVEIDRTRFLPVAVSYVERDGDTTSYAFSDIVVGKPLPDSVFSLDLPPDVKIERLKLHGGE
jgi:outer membrane lipoprotein-sorting protein